MGAFVYVHFDGYPAHMLPALARWKPEDILAVCEIRQVTREPLNCFSPPLLVAVALANKMARAIWAMLTRNEDDQDPAQAVHV